MIVAGFDIATTTGCAVLDGDNVLRCAAFSPEGETDAEIFHGFRAWFRGLLRHYSVDHIAIEQPLVTGRAPGTFRTYLRLYGLRAIALQSAQGLGIPLIEVHQMSWRKSFTGKARATKEETLALAQTMVPGLKSKDAAEAIGIARHLITVLNLVSETSEVGDAA
jgi:Holliday junction resolvasome RuvABC endonuclease subunit